MSEDPTKNLNDVPLNEQILRKLEVLDTRLQHVENAVREKAFNTKPIWEQALAAIMEVKQDVRAMNLKFEVFNGDMLEIRTRQLDADRRLRRIEDVESGSIQTIN